MTSDLGRRLAVTIAALACGLGTLFGFGILGTRVAENDGGSLAADATLLAPGSPAFSIWSVLYIGFAAYTLWQWLPRSAVPAVRRTGWWCALSFVLNGAWLLVTQADWIWASVVVILALAATLVVIIARIYGADRQRVRWDERLLLDGVFGLYLGWVTVASAANIMAALTSSGVAATSGAAYVMASTLLVLIAVIGVIYTRRLGGRWTPALAMAWGLVWVGIARWGSSPESLPVAVAAMVAAVVILLAPAVRQARLGAVHA